MIGTLSDEVVSAQTIGSFKRLDNFMDEDERWM